MKMLILLLIICGAESGCSTWNKLSEREQQTVVIAGTIVVGALIIRNGQGDTVNNCISTRSLETGCPDRL